MVDSIPTKVTIDFQKIMEPVNLAVRRASAILSIGIFDIEGREVNDLNYGGVFSFKAFPSPPPPDLLKFAKIEFTDWLVASCVAKMDSFISLFFDRISFYVSLAEMHGRSMDSSYVIKPETLRASNSAEKFKVLNEQIYIGDFYKNLNSIRLARNCLMHNFGIVRIRDTNIEGRSRLDISWIGFEVSYGRSGVVIVPEKYPFDTNELPGEGEVSVYMSRCEKVASFSVGEKINLRGDHIAEMCMFYVLVAGQVMDSFKKKLVDLGVAEEAELFNPSATA